MQVIGDPPFDFGFEKLGIILNEINMVMPDAPFSINVSTNTDYEGNKRRAFQVVVRYCGWELSRSWRYWVASSVVGLPKAAAERLNNDWGDDVRVDGFAGGMPVTRDVKSYHIDSLDGLYAFARAIERETKAAELAGKK